MEQVKFNSFFHSLPTSLNKNSLLFNENEIMHTYARALSLKIICPHAVHFSFYSLHAGPYKYQRQGHPPDPQGHPAKPIGLIHTFFRPSDDLQKYPYLIPSQFFAYHTLKLLLELANKLEWEKDFGGDISKLIASLHDILFDAKTLNNEESTITFKHPNHGLIYSYEIDGLNNRNLMDDSNVPSLLSLPYVCPDAIPLNHTIYQNTRKFILSTDNPWFFKGTALEGK